MGVTSMRLNKKEETILNYLKEHFHCDSSTLLKRSIYELYEDIKDRAIIEDYEKREGEKATRFIRFDELLK